MRSIHFGNLRFSAIGLSMLADGEFIPGHPGTRLDPPDAPEVNLEALTCEGKDAMFLLESNLSDDICEAVMDALLKEES